MTTLPFTLSIDPVPTQFLFTVRGTPAAADHEGVRAAHNQIAGSDQAVAFVRSCGDLSHNVFIPAAHTTGKPDELLFIDYWNSAEGLMKFFADPQVAAGGEAMFSQRDHVLWANTPGLPRISMPAPQTRNERFVGLVRGPVASRAKAENTLRDATRKALNGNRAKGLMAREWYFRLTAPGEPESLEAIGYDLWFDAEGMQTVYADPAEMAPLADLFTAKPATSVWKKPEGQWVEW
ncbi:MAG: hypothetical protein ABIO40_12310 [Devosia sp.]